MKFEQIELSEGAEWLSEGPVPVGSWLVVGETGLVISRTEAGWEVISDTGSGDVVISRLPALEQALVEQIATDMAEYHEGVQESFWDRGVLAGATQERERIAYGFQAVFGDLMRRR